MNTSQNSVFPKGEKAPTDYFTGTAWMNVLVPNDATFNCQVANVTFEPCARTTWHTHSGGQILMVTDGVGYYQELGKTIQVLNKGDVLTVAPHIKHWHGASHTSSFTHVAINPQNGSTDWLEAVSDKEYNDTK
ncbi:(R)-mandelonitrile lyase [Aurantibacillus circumpalustris]|uniref:(R)-mandelonitrile lyase n=1 Tax=Aurantibacillus circumpalustris TaxID=3036359 RepID=UPI00295B518A|nr:cupin domain-containing protein [Aurantibacillus circumpalustris]